MVYNLSATQWLNIYFILLRLTKGDEEKAKALVFEVEKILTKDM